MNRYFLVFALFLAVFTTTPALASDDDEINIAELQELAEKGDAEAQYKLGSAYQLGEGVPQNELQAVHWITKAANQNYGDAQFNLGMVYRGGFGVPVDYVTAYMWLELGVANNSNKAFELRRELSTQMTLDQIREAQYRAKRWKPNQDDDQ